jgi:hypothetical protein
MRDRRVILRAMFCGAVAIAFCGACPTVSLAEWPLTQWSGKEGSTTSGPSLDEYVKEVGADVQVIPQGQLKIDGMSVTCGKRPTVLNPNFDSWGGAFPGFMILNNKKIIGLSTQTKLYIFSHECGHQFEGADESKADLFAIRRGVKRGWLDAQGMEDICAFISQLKGDAVHPPGPQRCETMRKYYRDLVGASTQQTASPTSSAKPQTLAPPQ